MDRHIHRDSKVTYPMVNNTVEMRSETELGFDRSGLFRILLRSQVNNGIERQFLIHVLVRRI